jgi:hypothetical protein
MSEEEDEQWFKPCLSEVVLERIDSWRKAQHPAIEDRATAIAKLIEISQPDEYRLTDYIKVTLAGPTLKKVEKYMEDMAVWYEGAGKALLVLGLQQEKEREYERVIASYEEPATPEIDIEEDGEPLDLELEDWIDEVPFNE